MQLIKRKSINDDVPLSAFGACADIACKTCKFKNTGREPVGFDRSHCQFYPQDKPEDIYFFAAPCPYYVDEKA
ncbi:MAG TPA: hypothetical protein PLE16_13595 [Spirochaetota bacterium]|jgi:hypothetical protein|nr:hypothetical protein [Ruminococcus sp.]HPM35619.1 hypothetical protein [Spirochaetota bacterium]HRS65686.1 hypothetical protein [Spirochaetia bacterium]HRU99345.1 hypothetical protein [Ruminococcus sp.]